MNTCRIVKEFDFYRNDIQFEIRSTDSGKYCPTALTIQLDSGPEYRKSFNGDRVNSRTGSADREAGFNPGKIFFLSCARVIGTDKCLSDSLF